MLTEGAILTIKIATALIGAAATIFAFLGSHYTNKASKYERNENFQRKCAKKS